MSTKVSKAVTGAMITSATVIAADVAVNEADAALIRQEIPQPFTISAVDNNPSAMTVDVNLSELFFPAFNPALGTLRGVEFGITSTQIVQLGTLESLNSTVSLFSQSIARSSSDGAFNFLFDLLTGVGLPVAFDPNAFTAGRFPIVLETTVDFDDRDARGEFEWAGTAQLTYVFEVPEPEMLLLFATAVAVTAGARGKKRRKASN